MKTAKIKKEAEDARIQALKSREDAKKKAE